MLNNMYIKKRNRRLHADDLLLIKFILVTLNALFKRENVRIFGYLTVINSSCGAPSDCSVVRAFSHHSLTLISCLLFAFN